LSTWYSANVTQLQLHHVVNAPKVCTLQSKLSQAHQYILLLLWRICCVITAYFCNIIAAYSPHYCHMVL
jgi:hypothetical protein